MPAWALRRCAPDDVGCVVDTLDRPDDVPSSEAELAALIESYRSRGQTRSALVLMWIYVSRHPDRRRARGYAQILERSSSP